MGTYYRRVKQDTSAKDIDAYMAQVGFSALELDSLGGGAPDRLYGGRGLLILSELKTGKKKRQPTQVAWAQKWHGPPVYVWRTPEDARATLLALGLNV